MHCWSLCIVFPCASRVSNKPIQGSCCLYEQRLLLHKSTRSDILSVYWFLVTVTIVTRFPDLLEIRCV